MSKETCHSHLETDGASKLKNLRNAIFLVLAGVVGGGIMGYELDKKNNDMSVAIPPMAEIKKWQSELQASLSSIPPSAFGRKPQENLNVVQYPTLYSKMIEPNHELVMSDETLRACDKLKRQKEREERRGAVEAVDPNALFRKSFGVSDIQEIQQEMRSGVLVDQYEPLLDWINTFQGLSDRSAGIGEWTDATKNFHSFLSEFPFIFRKGDEKPTKSMMELITKMDMFQAGLLDACDVDIEGL
jgi:hypothetical protein